MIVDTNIKESGFSLVELMIVVGIIGVLAALAIPKFQTFQAKARMAEAKNMLTQIATLEETYHQESAVYLSVPAIGADISGTAKPPLCTNAGATDIGLVFHPCTPTNPRYQYSVLATANPGSQFTAFAVSGAVANNMICPGDVSHSFEIDATRRLDFAVPAAALADRAPPSTAPKIPKCQ